MANSEAYPGNTNFGDYLKDEEEGLDLEELVEPWHRYDTEDDEYVLLFTLGNCLTRGTWLNINQVWWWLNCLGGI
ncbi:hypothetical protein N7447_009638 [Penicillium robsamsonii]|uniref:uncharacterized protein n=1 Tax=Penicillium robsamsonii TaxID=1792511 RepID=UPI0025473C8B|nr:uncharacterized protein N7447_009638 [Penicillium robsamsonii]KAJ5817405.1 hypothetical protein N7447_009638 [Penicillium robsamsonii]